jgi:hypothetical protein
MPRPCPFRRPIEEAPRAAGPHEVCSLWPAQACGLGRQRAEDLNAGPFPLGAGQRDPFLQADELGLQQGAERAAGVLQPVVLLVDLLKERGIVGQHGVAVDRLAQLDQNCRGEPGDLGRGVLREGLKLLLVGGGDRPGKVRVAADRGGRVGQRVQDRRLRFA